MSEEVDFEKLFRACLKNVFAAEGIFYIGEPWGWPKEFSERDKEVAQKILDEIAAEMK